MLLYADDIDVAMVYDTIGRLQRQLKIMSEVCSKYGLTINMSKTNAIIFKIRGRLRTNATVYITIEPLVEHLFFQALLVYSYKRMLAYQADKVYTLLSLLMANAMVCLFNCCSTYMIY